MARADLVLFGHVVEFEPAVLAVHDALGTQDVAVVAAVQLVEHVLKSFLAELLRRLLAPGGEDVVGVVMMVMVALALGIVALLTVVVMVVMLVLVVLVVLVMVMVVMMPMLMFVLVMFIVIVMVVMLMLVLGLFDLVLAAHLFKKLVAQRHLFDGGEERLLDFRQMCICSADWINSSRNCGCAMPISASARSQVLSPFRFTMPYSVTI